MNRITDVRARLEAATGVPAILTAAYSAFDQLLLAIREHEERAESLLAAFVMAAASAADGRDALIAAPSLPLPLPRPTHAASSAGERATPANIDDVADELADLSRILVTQLGHAAGQAIDPSDRLSCTDAALSAEAVRSLLARPGQ